MWGICTVFFLWKADFLFHQDVELWRFPTPPHFTFLYLCSINLFSKLTSDHVQPARQTYSHSLALNGFWANLCIITQGWMLPFPPPFREDQRDERFPPAQLKSASMVTASAVKGRIGQFRKRSGPYCTLLKWNHSALKSRSLISCRQFWQQNQGRVQLTLRQFSRAETQKHSFCTDKDFEYCVYTDSSPFSLWWY